MKYTTEGKGIIEYVKNVFSKNSKFTNSTKSVLEKYGNNPVVGIQIMRTPIISAIDTALNVISLGSWNKLKRENSFDKLFHLFAIITVKLHSGERKKLLVEKNQSINVSEKIPDRTKDTDIMTIAWANKEGTTLNEMLNNALEKVGSDRFYIYRPFNDTPNGGNCQRFITDVLEANGLLSDFYKNWIMQDIEPLVKGLPDYVQKFSQTITDTASGLEKLIGGEKPKDGYELHAVIIKGLPFEEAQKIAQDIIKNKNRKFYRITKTGQMRFRNIPKTKMQKGSFRTKKVNKNINLIYGKLIS